MEKKKQQQPERHLRRRNFPDWLIETLGKVRPDFKNEQPHHQHKLAHLAWEIGDNRRKQHLAHPDHASIGFAELDGKFGRSQFPKINERVKLFDRKESHFKEDGRQGYTAALRLMPDVEKAMRDKMRQIRQNKSTIKLLDEEGRQVRTIPPAVGSKDIWGRTITGWNEGKVPKAVKIDMMQLKLLIKHLERQCDSRTGDLFAETSAEDLDRLLTMAHKMLVMASTDIAPGALIHQYEQVDSGRLYAYGVNLQNCQRLLKQVALQGLWDYDIANCHFTIFQQMAAAVNVDTPHITDYLNNKAATRMEIAERVGITIDQTKKCLLALMYGASTKIEKPKIGDRKMDDNLTDIAKELGVEAALRLFAHPTFMAIAEDIKAGRAAILAAQPITSGRGGKVIKNIKGLSLSADSTPAQKLSHLTHGVEALMLDLINREYGDDIQVFQHDGFVSLRRLHVGDIEKMISEATGYRVTLEEKRLDIPADLNKPRGI
jgi:hypothetical protein